MKKLLITHTDLDGVSPIILLNLLNIDFDYKNIEISEIDNYFNELFKTDLSIYDTIYITDLTIPDYIYKYFIDHNINILVFDHHKTHEYANIYPFVKVIIEYDGVQTCATEIFYKYLCTIDDNLNKDIIKDYVRLVRELDTYNFTSNKPKELNSLLHLYGKLDFIKSVTKRLKKESSTYEFTSFEKRYIKLNQKEIDRYLIRKENDVIKANINNYKCGIVFAETNKSELGNYLSSKYPELDLIIILDSSSSISYRTTRDDVDVSTFASIYGGGGHKKASGSPFNDEDRWNILENHFKDIERLKDDNL